MASITKPELVDRVTKAELQVDYLVLQMQAFIDKANNEDYDDIFGFQSYKEQLTALKRILTATPEPVASESKKKENLPWQRESTPVEVMQARLDPSSMHVDDIYTQYRAEQDLHMQAEILEQRQASVLGMDITRARREALERLRNQDTGDRMLWYSVHSGDSIL